MNEKRKIELIKTPDNLVRILNNALYDPEANVVFYVDEVIKEEHNTIYCISTRDFLNN